MDTVPVVHVRVTDRLLQAMLRRNWSKRQYRRWRGRLKDLRRSTAKGKT